MCRNVKSTGTRDPIIEGVCDGLDLIGYGLYAVGIVAGNLASGIIGGGGALTLAMALGAVLCVVSTSHKVR